MAGKSRNFQSRHNRVITNYVGPGPLLVEEFTNHIAGSFLPAVPEHLVRYQEEIRRKKSNVSHFFLVLEETFDGSNLSPRLEQLLRKAFTNSKIDEVRIDPSFLEDLMDAIDHLKMQFASESPDRIYLDKLISTIFSFYKLLKKR